MPMSRKVPVISSVDKVEHERFAKLSGSVGRMVGKYTSTHELPDPTASEAERDVVLENTAKRRELRRELVSPGNRRLPYFAQKHAVVFERAQKTLSNPDDDERVFTELLEAKDVVSGIIARHEQGSLERQSIHEEVGEWVQSMPEHSKESNAEGVMRIRELEIEMDEELHGLQEIVKNTHDMETAVTNLNAFAHVLKQTLSQASKFPQMSHAAAVSIPTGRITKKRTVGTSTGIIVSSGFKTMSRSMIPKSCRSLPVELFELEEEEKDWGRSSLDAQVSAAMMGGDDVYRMQHANKVHQQLGEVLPPCGGEGKISSGNSAALNEAVGKLEKKLITKSSLLVDSMKQRECVVRRSILRVGELKTKLAEKERVIVESKDEIQKLLEDKGFTDLWIDDGCETSASQFMRSNMDMIMDNLRSDLRDEAMRFHAQVKNAEEENRNLVQSVKRRKDGSAVTESEMRLEMLNTDLRKDNDRLKTVIAMQSATMSTYRTEATQAKVLAATAKAECEAAQSNLDEALIRNNALVDSLGLRTEKADALEKKLATLVSATTVSLSVEAMKKNFRGMLETKEQHISALQARIDAMYKANEESDSELVVVRKQYEAVMTQLEEHQSGSASKEFTEKLSTEYHTIVTWMSNAIQQLRTSVEKDTSSALRDQANTLSTAMFTALMRSIRTAEPFLSPSVSTQSTFKWIETELSKAKSSTVNAKVTTGKVIDPAEQQIEELKKTIVDMEECAQQEKMELETKMDSVAQLVDEKQFALQQQSNLLRWLHAGIATLCKTKDSVTIGTCLFELPVSLSNATHPEMRESWPLAKQAWLLVKQRLLSDADVDVSFDAQLKQKLRRLEDSTESFLFTDFMRTLREFSNDVHFCLIKPFRQILSTLSEEMTNSSKNNPTGQQNKTAIRKLNQQLDKYISASIVSARVALRSTQIVETTKSVVNRMHLSISVCSDQYQSMHTRLTRQLEVCRKSMVGTDGADSNDAESMAEQSKLRKRLVELDNTRNNVVRNLEAHIEQRESIQRTELLRLWNELKDMPASRCKFLRTISSLLPRVLEDDICAPIRRDAQHLIISEASRRVAVGREGQQGLPGATVETNQAHMERGDNDDELNSQQPRVTINDDNDNVESFSNNIELEGILTLGELSNRAEMLVLRNQELTQEVTKLKEVVEDRSRRAEELLAKNIELSAIVCQAQQAASPRGSSSSRVGGAGGGSNSSRSRHGGQGSKGESTITSARSSGDAETKNGTIESGSQQKQQPSGGGSTRLSAVKVLQLGKDSITRKFEEVQRLGESSFMELGSLLGLGPATVFSEEGLKTIVGALKLLKKKTISASESLRAEGSYMGPSVMELLEAEAEREAKYHSQSTQCNMVLLCSSVSQTNNDDTTTTDDDNKGKGVDSNIHAHPVFGNDDDDADPFAVTYSAGGSLRSSSAQHQRLQRRHSQQRRGSASQLHSATPGDGGSGEGVAGIGVLQRRVSVSGHPTRARAASLAMAMPPTPLMGSTITEATTRTLSSTTQSMAEEEGGEHRAMMLKGERREAASSPDDAVVQTAVTTAQQQQKREQLLPPHYSSSPTLIDRAVIQGLDPTPTSTNAKAIVATPTNITTSTVSTQTLAMTTTTGKAPRLQLRSRTESTQTDSELLMSHIQTMAEVLLVQQQQQLRLNGSVTTTVDTLSSTRHIVDIIVPREGDRAMPTIIPSMTTTMRGRDGHDNNKEHATTTVGSSSPNHHHVKARIESARLTAQELTTQGYVDRCLEHPPTPQKQRPGSAAAAATTIIAVGRNKTNIPPSFVPSTRVAHHFHDRQNVTLFSHEVTPTKTNHHHHHRRHHSKTSECVSVEKLVSGIIPTRKDDSITSTKTPATSKEAETSQKTPMGVKEMTRGYLRTRPSSALK